MKILLKDGVTVLDRKPLIAKFYVLKRGASYVTDESQEVKAKKVTVKPSKKAKKVKK